MSYISKITVATNCSTVLVSKNLKINITFSRTKKKEKKKALSFKHWAFLSLKAQKLEDLLTEQYLIIQLSENIRIHKSGVTTLSRDSSNILVQ